MQISGALTAILDEVADQETMDVLLAYAFLWKGRRIPPGMTRSQLTKEIEAFLNGLLEAHGVETQIVFNARGACERLETMGLFQRYMDSPGEPWMQVVNMDTALQKLSSVDLTKRLRQDSFGFNHVTPEYEELDIHVS